jgi:hypothetical protein
MKSQWIRMCKEARGVPTALSYACAKSKGATAPNGEVRVDLYENLYSRYLYSFFKFLTIEGYRVVLKARPATLYSIKHSQYGALLLEERLLELTLSGKAGFLLGDRVGGKRLAPWDFTKPDDLNDDRSVYRVPMAQHPMMYASGCWSAAVDRDEAPVNALLFIGNPDPGVYSKISDDHVFDVVDRITLWNLLTDRGDVIEVARTADLPVDASGKVVLIDSRTAHLPFETFRSFLAGFRFFLCAPGVFMPLCHNLVEVLSVGGVPVIQKSYAELLSPPLSDGVNAIIFEGEEDIHEVVDRCLRLGEDAVERLSQAAAAYYENHLTPSAVTRSVLDPQVKTVRLLAGEHSVRLLRHQLSPT